MNTRDEILLSHRAGWRMVDVDLLDRGIAHRSLPRVRLLKYFLTIRPNIWQQMAANFMPSAQKQGFLFTARPRRTLAASRTLAAQRCLRQRYHLDDAASQIKKRQRSRADDMARLVLSNGCLRPSSSTRSIVTGCLMGGAKRYGTCTFQTPNGRSRSNIPKFCT